MQKWFRRRATGTGPFLAFVALLTAVVAAYGAFILPRAASTELPRAAPSARANVVLASAGLGDEENSCPWKRDQGTETIVDLYSGA
jgi:hypothetical protein